MILIVCGPAGAGKTTIATGLRARFAERGRHFEILHSDQFGRNTYERLYDRVADSDDDWIVDGTFYKREWQRRFHALGDVVMVYLDADLETCLERNRNRPDPIDDRAVRIIRYEFDEPDADVTVDTTAGTPEEVVDRLLRRLDPFFDERLADAG